MGCSARHSNARGQGNCRADREPVDGRALDSPLTKGPIRFLDPALVIDEHEKWSKLYDEIIVKQSR